MKISLSKIQNSLDEAVLINEEVLLPEKFEEYDLEPITSLKVVGNLKKHAEGVVLSAKGEASFKTFCARCGKEIEIEVSYDVFNILSREKQNDENDEIIQLLSDEIHTDELMLQNLFLNLSMKYLCKPDCKGLCESCGADLNKGACSCEKDEIDPRLQIFKKLLEEHNR